MTRPPMNARELAMEDPSMEDLAAASAWWDREVTTLHLPDGSCCGEQAWERDHPYPPPWKQGVSLRCPVDGIFFRADCVGCPPSPMIGYAHAYWNPLPGRPA